MRTKEEQQARSNFWSNMIRLGKQITGEIEVEDLSDVAPHLVGRRA